MDKVVIIGAGVGGLATAMRLAAKGVDVHVVETQTYPGGKMRQIETPAGPADAGPTVLTMRHVFDDLFREAGCKLADYVTLTEEETLARHFWKDGSTLDLFQNTEKSAAAIRAFSGERSEAEFRAFHRSTAQLFSEFDAPMMQAHKPTFAALARHVAPRPALLRAMRPLSTLASALARQFSDPRLRQLFGRYATYVGGSPYASPALLGLIWQSEAAGVWRVGGGMHQLACGMAQAATDLGARFSYGTAAERIEFQSGKIVAIHLKTGEKIRADRVVFNGDPRALHRGLLGAGSRKAVSPQGVTKRSLSANVWAFAARPRGPELLHHNVFFGANPRTEFEPLEAGRCAEDPTLYICAQDRGTGSLPPELERFEMIMNAPPLPGGDDEEAETCQTRAFQALKDFGLTFSPEPGDKYLTTPSGFEALFPGSQGSLYGRSPHGLTAAFDRPTAQSRINGLYLAGGGTHPGAGVPMATLSGKHAAEAILTDLALTSTSRQTAMRGGMSTA